MVTDIKRQLQIPKGSSVQADEYRDFLKESYSYLSQFANYLPASEDINALELAHLIPSVKETMLAIYLGINDAVCNKGLVTALLPQHGHNNVFVFEPQIYSGGNDVPSGTVDARSILVGFEAPNETWNANWTYLMIEDVALSYKQLWKSKGYIDMIPAKFEDFTLMTNPTISKVCFFVSQKAFDHPVNKQRCYLKDARKKGEKQFDQFHIPAEISDEFEELVPVILEQGEKLFIAATDFGPCAHGWCNIHPDNKQLAVINEVSAVPLDLVIQKPPINSIYAAKIKPARGSADMTTDWFKRGNQIIRTPILQGTFKG